MARRRFFVPSVQRGEALLEGDEARHLTQVLRVESGEIYEISDNNTLFLAEVTQARKATVVFRVLETLPPEPTLTPVTLLAAIFKFERLELLIEKATELGVTEIKLVRAERSEKGLELAVPKRIARWNRIALEASQQSRRTTLPVLSGPITLREALKTTAEHRLVLDEDRTGASLLDILRGPASTAILLGPEGGWPDHEREASRAAGWQPVSLGPLVLRAETAAIAALSVLNSAFLRGR